jgi:nucleoside-triphosphatase
MPNNLLLTGRPGVGKTTVIQRTLAWMPSLRSSGFTTAEIRGDRGRLGFRATTLDGREIVLAHVDIRSRHRVSRYGVDVPGFEREIVAGLDPRRQADVFVVDEIGKMECFSEAFCAAIERLLDDPRPLLGTIALRGPAFIQQVRRRTDVELIEVTRANRQALPETIAAWLSSRLSSGAAETG